MVGFNIVLFNFFMLLLKQCRHIVQKVKYDRKIYIRKNTSLSSNLVPRVNTFAFWTCSLRYSSSCFQASFTTTALSSVDGFCCSALISYPGNESLAFLSHPLPPLLHYPPSHFWLQVRAVLLPVCYYDHADIAYCLF